MSTVDEATRCIQELNGVVCLLLCVEFRPLTCFQELNGRRIRVDYSVTDRPHAPTPGEYMGHRKSSHRDGYRDRDSYRDRDYRDREHRDRDRDYRRGDRDRDRDPYGRDNRSDWRDRRSPPRRYSPEYRRRRSYSRSPPRGSSPSRNRDYDASVQNGSGEGHRW